MRSHLSWFTASASDLSTVALALWPLGHFARRHACSIWSAARATKGFSGPYSGRGYPPFATTADHRDSDWNRYSAIGVLAYETCLELEDASARAILDGSEDQEDEERMKTVESARYLGGKIAQLGDTLQNMWTMGIWELNDISLPRDDAEEQPLDPRFELELVLEKILITSFLSSFLATLLGSCPVTIIVVAVLLVLSAVFNAIGWTNPRPPSIRSTPSAKAVSTLSTGHKLPPISTVTTVPPWAKDEPPSPQEETSASVSQLQAHSLSSNDVASFRSSQYGKHQREGSSSLSRWFPLTMPHQGARPPPPTDDEENAPIRELHRKASTFRDKRLSWLANSTIQEPPASFSKEKTISDAECNGEA
ncbi:hypothetical protein F5880DRAFT_1617975 [Lentinula raphanica]|nr:hypothetical protein F5880DRAFT_1617975 [Lentinula raphanica]